MKRSIVFWQIIGFAVVALAGSVLHFLYGIFGDAVWIAPFSSVNESTWEHMKLFFWPAFIFAIVQSFFFQDRKDFWCIKLHGVLLGLLLIPVLFYTYNGIVGSSPDWLNIAFFFISVACAFLYESKLFNHPRGCKSPAFAITVLCIIAVAFILFTFLPPKINVFQDPISGRYGVQ